jgi:hypothetical protein
LACGAKSSAASTGTMISPLGTKRCSGTTLGQVRTGVLDAEHLVGFMHLIRRSMRVRDLDLLDRVRGHLMRDDAERFFDAVQVPSLELFVEPIPEGTNGSAAIALQKRSTCWSSLRTSRRGMDTAGCPIQI